MWVSKLVHSTYKWADIIIPFKKLGGNAIKARIILQEMYYNSIIACACCGEMLGGIMVSEIVAPHAFG